ncbi:MAG: DUF1743 domain-containing protein [Candidatus Methanomethylophilaceae archaeon]
MVNILRPDQVSEKYGKLFCQGFFTMVDEKNGVAQIVEKCTARGPIEWDVVNRKRTGGVITDIRIDGYTIIMDAVIGEKELKFGPVSAELGGQGISSLKIEGDRVHTRWMGLAGASVGIGACIPQSSDVIETVYPDDFSIGGAHRASVEIVTPKMVRVVIGVDDTDTPQKGASWVTTMKLARDCPYGRFLDHKIIQLNPKAPNKTTNCCSTAVSFAAKSDEVDKIIAYCKEYLIKETLSDETVMTVFIGLKIPDELQEWGWGAKYILYEEKAAIEVAERNGVQVIPITGKRGIIGAVAAIGCFDLGVRSAGVPEDFE